MSAAVVGPERAEVQRLREVICRARAAYEAVTGVPEAQARIGGYQPGEHLIQGPAGVTTLEQAAGVLDVLDAGPVQVDGSAVLLRGWWAVPVHGACADGTGFVVVVDDPHDVAAMTDGVAGECEACEAHAARALITTADGRVRLCTGCLAQGLDLIDEIRLPVQFSADAVRSAVSDLAGPFNPRLRDALEACLEEART